MFRGDLGDEEALAQHQGTKLHLEKLQNEKHDARRRIQELKQEDKDVREQLQIKRKELQELEEMVLTESTIILVIQDKMFNQI